MAMQCARNLAASASASDIHFVEERGVGHAAPGQVDLHPLDRVEQLPGLGLVGQPIAARIVGCGVGVHPVRERFDEHRTVARPALVQCPPGHREAGQHVVPVHPYAGKAIAPGAIEQRNPRLTLDRLRDGPLIVLAVEDDGRVVGGGEDHPLVRVTLTRRTVPEERDRCFRIASGARLFRPAADPSRTRWR